MAVDSLPKPQPEIRYQTKRKHKDKWTERTQTRKKGHKQQKCEASNIWNDINPCVWIYQDVVDVLIYHDNY